MTDRDRGRGGPDRVGGRGMLPPTMDWALQLARNLDARDGTGWAWRPVELPGIPPSLVMRGPDAVADDVAQHRRQHTSPSGDAATWIAWRNDVTVRECRNAGKLSTLLGAWLELRSSVESGDTSSEVIGAEAMLREFVWQEWGINEVPESRVGLGPLAVRATRSYQAMPREWRDL